MDHGIFVALGSDILPIDPRVGLYATVTRKGMSGEVYGPDEALTIQEAIRGYTANGAFLTFEEDTKGTLEPGMRADVNVIDPQRLAVARPRTVADLPAGGERFLQDASGYLATILAGVVTRRNDRDTGERPGRLIRGQQG